MLHSRRTIANAIFYLIRSGCAWRLLPKDLPPWQTVYHYWRRWRLDGTRHRRTTAVRARVRRRVGRNAQPSASIIDRQSRKTTSVGGVRGYNGGKQISGRNRHLLVDTLGLRANVHAADLHDRAAVPLLLAGASTEYPRMELVWVDRGYTGTGAQWIGEQRGWQVEIGHHPPRAGRAWQWVIDPDDPMTLRFRWVKMARTATGFRSVLPRRWVRGTVVRMVGASSTPQ